MLSIACECISPGIAENQCGCTHSRAQCSASQSVRLTRCDLTRSSCKYKFWGDSLKWVCRRLHLTVRACSKHTIVWRNACLVHFHVFVSHLGALVKCTRGEALSDCSPEGLHSVTAVAFPQSRGCGCHAADATLPPSPEAQIWGTRYVSSSSSLKMMLPQQTPDTFAFSFTTEQRFSVHARCCIYRPKIFKPKKCIFSKQAYLK